MPKAKTQEQIDKNELYLFYKSIVPSVTKVVFNTQYKRLKEDNPSITPKQIEAVIKYAIKNKNMTITSLLIVPYLFDECKKYYQRKAEIKKQLCNFKQISEEINIVRTNRKEDIFI